MQGPGSGARLEGNLFQEGGDDFIGGEALHPRVVLKDDTMAKDGGSHELDILEAGVSALVHECVRPC